MNLVELTDLELYMAARRIADMLYEYNVSPDVHCPTDYYWKEDRRKETANPYYNQTKRGLFLELYYGSLGYIWTPWGKWGCWGGGSGDWDTIIPKMLERLGSEVYRPLRYSEMGEYGPIYTITKVDALKLPHPFERPRNEYLSYKDALDKWEELTQQYQASK